MTNDSYTTAKIDTKAPHSGYRKPRPVIDVWNKPFWDAARLHKLVAQKDPQGNVWLPPGPISPVTRSLEWTWTELSGKGTVVSWVVFHQKYFAGFADDLPYNVATVRLDEGPRILTNIVNVENKEIHIGMRVSVTFNDADENLSIPVFQPIDQE